MMKFKNIEEAKKELIKTLLLEQKAVLDDDDELQEINIKKAYKIDKFIKQKFDLREMKDLLEHENLGVRSWIANMLLPLYEDISIKVLKEIVEKEIPFTSYSAEMMLFNWERKKT